MECPWRPGELVTGRDRHYERSIYEFIKDEGGGEGLYKIHAYKGRTDFTQVKEFYNRDHNEFKLATWIEIKCASSRSHIELKNFLSLLKIIRYKSNI